MPAVAVVGGGAAGLATAIFAARKGLTVTVLDGARSLGAKILVSGGGRCNVTNRSVEAGDFWLARSSFVRRVLGAFPAEAACRFFGELGVTLHEEPGGKLFPDTNQARTILQALVAEAERRGVTLKADQRVTSVIRSGTGFALETSRGPIEAERLVLATGGLSLPKTGSDGGGYRLAQSLGHSLVPTTPALAPLVLEGAFHPPLSGVSQPVVISVYVAGRKRVDVAGSMLWTHFGISGPVALDASRFWHRARLLGEDVRLVANLVPPADFASLEAGLLAEASASAGRQLDAALALWLPASVANAILGHLEIDRSTPLGRLRREDRRRLVKALVEWPLPVRDSRGYNFAEVTAGGVPLSEVNAATMASRPCPGLHLVGEILDVDGRIGGFNFQWAWSTGFVAAGGLPG